MKWVLSFIFFLTLALPVFAEEFNAGFVQGLWYADESVLANTPTRIYVAIRNNTSADLTGVVEFFDNDKRIARKNVSALDGRIIESWADWTPNYGTHTITATLSRIELSTVGSSTESVEVVSARAEHIIFVDIDTDGDGIGNEEDADDDDDGITDEVEIENGSDPLDANDPPPEPVISQAESDEEKEQHTSSTKSDDGPEGLEQYLTDSRADTTLAAITDVINTTKKKVDDYRNTRNTTVEAATDEEEITTPESETDETSSSTESYIGSFGEITRSQEAKSSGFVAAVVQLLKMLVTGTYTLLLFVLSQYLAHPMIVQLTFLFLILFALYKTTKRLGGRPQ